MGQFQIFGYGAFILASTVLGIRLLILASRTGEVPERALGLSFLAGGAIGYALMFVGAFKSASGAPIAEVHPFTVAGLVSACLASFLIARASRSIFRSESDWAPWLVLGLGALMVTFCGLFATRPVDEPVVRARLLWATFMTASASYTWATWECFRLRELLQKRARLGLASPLLADRARLWGIAFGSVILMYWVPFGDYLLHSLDAAPRTWVSTMTSGLGLVCAGAIWLGFFPPAFYRRRFDAPTPAERA